MNKLHPNAFWLFWIRSIFATTHSGKRGAKNISVFLPIIIYFAIFAFVLSKFTCTQLNFFTPQFNNIKFNSHQVIPLIIIVFSIYLFISFIKSYMYFNSYGYQINDQSITVKKGIFSIQESEVPFDKIQNIDIVRGPLHQLFGLSSIYIQTAGYSRPQNNDIEKNNTLSSEAGIDGISKEDAENIKQLIFSKIKK